MKRYLVVFIALLLFGPISRAQAKDWDPRLEQAVFLSYSGNPQAAQPLIQSYIKETPLDPNGLFVQALVQEWENGLSPRNHVAAYPELEQIYKKANKMAFYLWEKKPEDVDALIDLGNSYLLLARIYGKQGSSFKAGLTGKKAQKHLEKALKKDPNRLDALMSLGALNYFAGKTPKAWQSIKKMFGIKGDKVLGLAQLHQSAKGEHPYAWNAKYALLEIYSRSEKNYEKALQLLDDFEKAFPDNPVIPLKRAWVLEKQAPLQGAQAYLKYAKSCPEVYPSCLPKFQFFAYLRLGKIYLNQGNHPQAWRWLAKALEIDPKTYPDQTAKVLLWKAQLAQEKGEAMAALTLYEQATKVPGVSKKTSKSIKKIRREVCRQKEFSGKC